MAKAAGREGHQVVFHRVVVDDVPAIGGAVCRAVAQDAPDGILVNGGTGISFADVTIEAVRPLFDKELSGFGVLFTQLSFAQIDSAAILSRATAGIIRTTAVFCMPGSLNACKLACRELIFPELGHIVRHLRKG